MERGARILAAALALGALVAACGGGGGGDARPVDAGDGGASASDGAGRDGAGAPGDGATADAGGAGDDGGPRDGGAREDGGGADAGAPDGALPTPDAGVVCDGGACPCVPDCGGRLGGADDRCGGRCPERVARACDGCPLVLALGAQSGRAGLVRTLDLTLDVQPDDPGRAPRIVDLRLAIDRPFRVVEVTPGAALEASGKSLVRFSETGAPWRLQRDGAVQILVLSTANTERLPAGRLCTVSLELGVAGAGDPGPVRVHLVRRDEIFAPADADALLQSTPYDAEVIALVAEPGPGR